MQKEGSGHTIAPANKGRPTNELALAASALRNRSCMAGDSLPSLTWAMFLPGSYISARPLRSQRQRQDGRSRGKGEGIGD